MLVLTGLELSKAPAKPISQTFAVVAAVDAFVGVAAVDAFVGVAPVAIVDGLVEALEVFEDVLEDADGERLGSIGVVPDVFVELVDVLLVLTAVSSQFCNAQCVNVSANSMVLQISDVWSTIQFSGFVLCFNSPRTGICQIHPSPSLTTWPPHRGW